MCVSQNSYAYRLSDQRPVSTPGRQSVEFCKKKNNNFIRFKMITLVILFLGMREITCPLFSKSDLGNQTLADIRANKCQFLKKMCSINWFRLPILGLKSANTAVQYLCCNKNYSSVRKFTKHIVLL